MGTTVQQVGQQAPWRRARSSPEEEQCVQRQGETKHTARGGRERSETARLLLSQDGSWGPPCSRVRIHTLQPFLKEHSLEKALSRVTVSC